MKPDYEQLLEHVNKEILHMLFSKKIDKFKFKTISENLRSCLEYIAVDINNNLKDPVKKPQFPGHFQQKDADKNKFLNNIKTERPDIFAFIDEIQPYKATDKWLNIFFSLTNVSKHNNLPILDTTKSIEIGKFIKISEDSEFKAKRIQFGNEIFENFHITKGSVYYDNQDSKKINFRVVNDEFIIFNDIKFHAINFLVDCLRKIVEFKGQYEKIK